MPAFDPVRDAVLNSPIIQNYPMPNHFLHTEQQPSPAISSPLASPSLSRRATDLSVLLNSDPPESPVRVSPSSRSGSHLSHILHDDEALGYSEPLRRTTQPWQSPAASTSASRPSSSSSSSLPQATPRTTVSPAMSFQPVAQPIPYAPKQRRTPAQSVLLPLSAEEIQTFASYRGTGTLRLTNKRKRAMSDQPDDQPPGKKLAGDVGMVVQHYNQRPEVGLVQRLESPIIGLKNFNNWVKSVIISRFGHPALSTGATGPGRARGKVLDMGCGKGGDISKWLKAKAREVVCVDIAAVSVEQARSRWKSLRGPKFEASFATLDCYEQSLDSAFPAERFKQPFDVVSMQFCMHYAFETESKARCMLRNVTKYLRPGGVFIGTIPNPDQLLDNLSAIPAESDSLEFGNAVYKIRFEDRDQKPVYGHRYYFYLQDAVENVPEYLVRWENFLQLASEYGLHLTYKEEFHEVYSEHQEHPEFGPLMVRMKVVDEHGESSMDEDQWEAANIYIAFAFEKR